MNFTFNHNQVFQLESGENLPELQLGYTTLGKLNDAGDNVVWITHALTANANPSEWWSGLVGPGKLYNPEEHFIVCVNVLGSCYGSTNPLSINKDTGAPYYHSFPQFTIRDVVKGLKLLRNHLGVTKIYTLLGGSLGGQQAVEWAIYEPSLIENLFLVATNAQHSPWGKAFNESQRMAIQTDETWLSSSAKAGLKGLKAARSIALLSYRNYEAYHKTQQDDNEEVDAFNASSYQNYQGEKLIKRFNAFSYWYLSKAMDSHNVGRGRGGVVNALNIIKAKTLIIGVSSDVLFPITESKLLNDGIKNSELVVIDSPFGHDGFLIETAQLQKEFTAFYQNKKVKQLKKIR